MKKKYNIGIFDSGYGGLTILKEIISVAHQYNYIYLGDNARTPYGTRSYETVYSYTLQAVKKLFELDCSLIIIACNTASAKALRTIQQQDLPNINPHKRILGVIRPCTEQANTFTKNNNIGIFATLGTVQSLSYEIEINKFFPDIHVTSHACPMWVPLVENGEAESEGADYFISKEISGLLSKNPNIDAILLACTHYPLLEKKIRAYTPDHISIINQGKIVAESLKKYLSSHPTIENELHTDSSCTFFTTDNCESFNKIGSSFLEIPIYSQKISLT